MKLMKWLILSIGIVCSGTVLGAFPVVDDGDAETISGTRDISGTDVYVGISTSGNGLIQSANAGLIANNGYIGSSASTSNNWMRLDQGAATVFNNFLIAGAAGGSSNAVYIGANSSVGSANGSLGHGSGADNNFVSVSGSDARWDVQYDLYAGQDGSGNRFEIKNGGAASAAQVLIGVSSTANNNSVDLSGGTLEAGAIAVGNDGSSNTMDVASGSTVSAVDAWVGFADTANGNVLTVSDSELELSGTLTVGSSLNSGNQVNADSGAEVSLNELLILGSGNAFNLNSGAQLTVASDLDASMTGFNFNDGSSLYVEGDLTGLSELEGGKTLGVYGTWNEAGSTLSVGNSSSGNELLIAQGGQVTALDFNLGTGSNSTDNTVNVSGSGSLLTVQDRLTIGSLLSSNQSITVESGGKMVVGGDLQIYAGSSLDLGSEGWLTVSNDFDASVAGFDFQSGASLEAMGELTGMSGLVESNRSVYLTGPSAVWDVSSGAFEVTDSLVALTNGAQLVSSSSELVSGTRVEVDSAMWNNSGTLVVGSSDGNLVVATNGGMVVSDNTRLGIGNNNRIIVSGSGTIWSTVNDFEIGAGGSGNVLQIEDGGALGVGGHLSLNDDSVLDFKTGGSASAASYYQDADAVFQFDSVTNVAVDPGAALLSVSGTADVEDGANFVYTGSIGAVDVGVTNSRQLIASGTLNVDTNTLNGALTGGLLSVGFLSQNDALYFQVYRQMLAESAGFGSNSQMYAVSEEIDALANGGNSAAVNQLRILDSMSGAQQNAQLTQLYDQGAPTFMHMAGLFDGMRQVQNRGVMPDKFWPIGAFGPHLYGSQVQGWIKGYGSWATQDGSAGFSGYDQSVYGVMIGFDKAYGDYLFGGAGGYASSDISQDDGDSSKSGTGFGMLYSSWGTSDWFANASLAYGLGSVKNNSGTAFDSSAEFDSSQFGYYLGGGKEMVFKEDRLFVTPSAGFLGGWYMQDGYTERSTTAVAKKVDAYNRWSLNSEIGAKVVFHQDFRRSVLMPEVHANWIHQFNADEEQVGYSLVNGTGDYSFGMAAPVSDLLEFGLGLSLWTGSKDGAVYEWGLGFDSRFGDGYSASALNARLVVEF
ncbi:autotransporter domain-containing protein [Pontiellaceae bacterium B12219]|nr:autotransporter domain-containing protein [Pontiellaceae bacterium B12219]